MRMQVTLPGRLNLLQVKVHHGVQLQQLDKLLVTVDRLLIGETKKTVVRKELLVQVLWVMLLTVGEKLLNLFISPLPRSLRRILGARLLRI